MGKEQPSNQSKIVGSAMGKNSRVQAQNIAGRDINVHHHYDQKDVTFPIRNLAPPNPSFVGREDLLEKLAAGVQSAPAFPIPPPASTIWQFCHIIKEIIRLQPN